MQEIDVSINIGGILVIIYGIDSDTHSILYRLVAPEYEAASVSARVELRSMSVGNCLGNSGTLRARTMDDIKILVAEANRVLACGIAQQTSMMSSVLADIESARPLGDRIDAAVAAALAEQRARLLAAIGTDARRIAASKVRAALA